MERNRPYRLTAGYVAGLTEPGRYGDGRGGNGLSLLVKPTARDDMAKSWAQRLQLGGGKVRSIGLGAYPAVTLSAARRAAADNAARLREGRPLAVCGSAPRSTGPTLAEAMEATIGVHAAAWKPGSRTEAQWRRAFDAYVLPRLGRRPVSEITPSDLLTVLEPIVREKPQTGKKVRGWLGMTFKWAATHGHRTDNPTAALSGALPRMGQGGHHRAVPVAEVPAAVAAIRGASGVWPGTRLALELLVLTAVRSGEVRGARWEEVDLEGRTWAISAARTKTGREHRVPLSEPALRVLDEAREVADGSGLVFPSQAGRALDEGDEGALRRLVRDLGLPGTSHGFRSSFRDFCGLEGVEFEVAEAALAHSRSSVVAAYHRSDLFDRRRELMDRWGAYAARGGEVVAFRAA